MTDPSALVIQGTLVLNLSNAAIIHLTLGPNAGFTASELAKDIVKKFLKTEFSKERFQTLFKNQRHNAQIAEKINV